jgi:hypothetical protein
MIGAALCGAAGTGQRGVNEFSAGGALHTAVEERVVEHMCTAIDADMLCANIVKPIGATLHQRQRRRIENCGLHGVFSWSGRPARSGTLHKPPSAAQP